MPPKLIGDVMPAGSTRLQVLSNEGEAGDGFDLNVQRIGVDGKAIGKAAKLWIHKDHYGKLMVDDDNVITNGSLSRRKTGITCDEVNAPESTYGFGE